MLDNVYIMLDKMSNSTPKHFHHLYFWSIGCLNSREGKRYIYKRRLDHFPRVESHYKQCLFVGDDLTGGNQSITVFGASRLDKTF